MAAKKKAAKKAAAKKKAAKKAPAKKAAAQQEAPVEAAPAPVAEAPATQPGDDVGTANGIGQPPADLGQKTVAVLVPEQPVDTLEIVDIDMGDRDPHTASGGARQHSRQFTEEAGTVAQSGQRVGAGQHCQAFLQFVLREPILGDGEVPLNASFLVGNRRNGHPFGKHGAILALIDHFAAPARAGRPGRR